MKTSGRFAQQNRGMVCYLSSLREWDIRGQAIFEFFYLTKRKTPGRFCRQNRGVTFIKKAEVLSSAFLNVYQNKPSAQDLSFSSLTLFEKRFPSKTLAFGAKACIFLPESPIPLMPDVANGTTILPAKS